MTFQSGQIILSAIPAQFLLPVDNGGSTLTSLKCGSGSFTADGATPVSVADTNITATSAIFIYLLTVGGTVGAIPAVQTKTASTGFTVAGTASDTSVYGYLVIY